MQASVRWVEHTNVEFIGRMEHIDEDLKKLLNLIMLGIASIPHLNVTAHKAYYKYYCEESRHIVEKFYREDFEYFRYALTGP